MKQEELEELGTNYLNSDNYKNDKKRHEEQLKIRDKFVKQFTLDKLKLMTIDDYIEGKGSKASFCYQIEFGMQWLGQIRGSFANSKFVLHYSKEKKDYTFQSGKFGSSLNEVFNNVRQEIIKLVEDGANDNIDGLENNKLSKMFRGKIYYVYYPDKTLPIYNSEHIDFFMKNMGIPVTDDLNYFHKIKMMLQWKNDSTVFRDFSNLEFMAFLYSSYGFQKEINILKGKNELSNIEPEFITDQTIIDRVVRESTKAHRIPNFEEINRKKSAVGMNGELFVLEYEKKKNKKYARKIKRVGNETSLGYDIESYDVDGNVKHIEVKTCSSGSLEKIDFFISSNEYDKLQNDPLYVLYYVCGLSSKNPKILVLNKNNLVDVTFTPIAYKIRGKVDE